MKQSIKKLILPIIILLSVGPTALAQRFSVGTNAVDLFTFATLEAEASVAVAQQFSLHVGAELNPWTWNANNPEKQLQVRQNSYWAGVRFWPWHVYSGWWAGLQARWQEYNRNGEFISRADLTEEGNAFGVGLSGGYTLMLMPNLNVEFGFGVWGGKTYFRSYDCPTCGMPVDEGEKLFFLPNEAILSLVYVF